MRAPRAAWLALVAMIAVVGAGLLALAYTITGQHAHGRWIEPAKVVGLVIVLIAACGMLLILRMPGGRDP